MPTVPPSTTDYKTGKVVNVSSTLNIRKSPSTSSEIVGTLKADAEVKILETLNGWYKIVYGNTTGYVSSQYISVVSSNTNSSQGSTNTTKTIGKVVGISTSLNVRQSPSTSASVLGYLLNNDEVEILSTSNGWHKILFRDNKIGYVSTKYIEVKTQRLIKETIVGDEKARVVNVTTNLTVLEGSDLNSQVIGYLLNNDDVIIKDEVKDFYKIRFENSQDVKEGYVNRAYIELI